MTLIENIATGIAIVASTTSVVINLWAIYTMRRLIGKTLARDARALVQRIERNTNPKDAP